MQALDSFISPVPDFDGDIPILAVPVSARPPSDEPVSDPSIGKSPRKPQGDLQMGSKSMNLHPRLLL
jgi:hypothetical protein